MVPIPFDLDKLPEGTLVPVVTQDAVTGVVLMVAWADREALERTRTTGEMHYRSRKRGLWHKGATSGNTQRTVSLAWDCDADTVLARVIADGPACHEGTTSCFRDDALDADALATLDRVIVSRVEAGDTLGGGYTQRLLADRNLRLKKLGEEASELAVACADGDRARAIEETADLFYHALVALRGAGAGLDDVRRELAKRAAKG